MKEWLNQHQQALKQVLSRMRHHLLATFMMCCVMGVTLCLPSMLYVIVDNLNRLAGNVKNEPQITLFLKLDSSSATVDKIREQLSQDNMVDHYQFVDKSMAWQKLQESEGTKLVTSDLDKNPLPDAFFVFPKSVAPEAIAQLQSQLQSLDGVELAQVDANWIKRFDAILQLAKQAILVLVGLLGFALLAIIGNTVRLQIMTQREEIEVSQLIGATNSFIRRPFLYAGALYGLGGGVAAFGMLAGVVYVFNQSIAKIANLYASDFSLSLPQPTLVIGLIVAAICLGWVAAYFAVSRSLAQLGPHQ